MQWRRFYIRPLTAFGSLIRGDTLFGQLCWAVRDRFGVARLETLLDEYLSGRPFLVVSDGFPAGQLPRPKLPLARIGNIRLEPEQRKTFKERAFIPEDWVAGEPDLAATISKLAQEGEERAASNDTAAMRYWNATPHLRNSISRLTATTGGGFDPYGQEELVAPPGQHFVIHAVFDEKRLAAADLAQLMEDIGCTGYGRDASVGLGKFQVIEIADGRPGEQQQANAWLTLAPCAPQGGNWIAEDCFYQPFTRFGRHGSIAAVGPNPFKRPILLADTGAVLRPRTFEQERLFAGHGLGGAAMPISLDAAFVATVHQGYAPVLPVRLPQRLAEPGPEHRSVETVR